MANDKGLEEEEVGRRRALDPPHPEGCKYVTAVQGSPPPFRLARRVGDTSAHPAPKPWALLPPSVRPNKITPTIVPFHASHVRRERRLRRGKVAVKRVTSGTIYSGRAHEYALAARTSGPRDKSAGPFFVLLRLTAQSSNVSRGIWFVGRNARGRVGDRLPRSVPRLLPRRTAPRRPPRGPPIMPRLSISIASN